MGVAKVHIWSGSHCFVNVPQFGPEPVSRRSSFQNQFLRRVSEGWGFQRQVAI